LTVKNKDLNASVLQSNKVNREIMLSEKGQSSSLFGQQVLAPL
jgi:hypothetical protein